jgi:hypothetical protein
MPSKNRVVLCGKVYGNSDTYVHLGAPPAKPEEGSLKVWAWSGNAEDPRSKPDRGVLRVLVFDGKKWRRLRPNISGITSQLEFGTARERERRIADLVIELVRLTNRVACKIQQGWRVLPYEAPAEPAPAPEAVKPVSKPAPGAPSQAVAPAGSFNRPRGRIKPFMRLGDAAATVVSRMMPPEAEPAAPAMEPIARTAATATTSAATLAKPPRRRRTRTPDPRQGDFFPPQS